jgi:twinkle protein
MGDCVEKLPHDECGSSDGLQVFHDDGVFTGFCFSCGTYVNDPYGDKPPPKYEPPSPEEVEAQVRELIKYPCTDVPDRRLKKFAFERFGCRMEVSQADGRTPTLVYFPYGTDEGLIGWKARPLKTKKMWAVGTTRGAQLFGWKQAVRSGAKTLYITEGEYDAIALYQVLKESNAGTAYADMEHAVVSLTSGSGSAKKEISEMVQQIREHFDEIVLVFDMDEPGQKAADQVCRIVPEAKVAKLPCKDANDCLMQGAAKALKSAVVFKAAKPKNSRVVYGSQLREAARKEPTFGLSWPWEGLTQATRGIRRGETIYIGAGVKMGKSEVVNAIAAHIIQEHNSPVYMIKPEEALAKSYKMVLGKVAGRIFHDPTVPFDHEAFDKADAQVGDKAIFQDIYQFGRWDDLKNDITYTVLNDGVRDVIIDPITCFTNTMSAAQANEHLTTVAAELSALAKDLDFTAYIFCHLKAPDGIPHERGGQVFSTQFAGSRAMMRSCNYMIGIEGNKDPDLPIEERNVRTLKLLEDREFGMTANVPLYWDRATGLFNEIKQGYHTN